MTVKEDKMIYLKNDCPDQLGNRLHFYLSSISELTP